MPLANKSPWSSVGCFCNNRRLGSLVWMLQESFTETNANGKKYRASNRFSAWVSPLIIPSRSWSSCSDEKHTRMGIAGLLVLCHICLHWIITESSGMPLMANHEGENGPCKGSNTATWDPRTAVIIVQSCWGWSGSFPIRDRERWQDLQAPQTLDFWCCLQYKIRWVISWTNSFTKFG